MKLYLSEKLGDATKCDKCGVVGPTEKAGTVTVSSDRLDLDVPGGMFDVCSDCRREIVKLMKFRLYENEDSPVDNG